MANKRKRESGPARTARLRRVSLVVVALGVTAVGLILYEANVLRSLDLSTMDARFAIRGTQKPPKDIVLVEVDDETFLQIQYLWPFPRSVDAQVLNNIESDKPAAVADDIQMSDPSPCPVTGPKPPPSGGDCPQAMNDELTFLDALLNAPRPVVLSITNPTVSGYYTVLGEQGPQILAKVGARPGNTGFLIDPGNFDRRLTYSLQGMPTFAVATAEVALRHKIDPDPFGGSGGVWIDYAYPAGTFATVSFSTVYRNRPCPSASTPISVAENDGCIPPGYFHNKIVVIGPSASSLQDFHPTPTNAFMPGAEVQANAISTVLRGEPLRSVAGWIDIALIVLLGLATPLAALRVGPIATIVMFAVLAAAFVVGAQVAFDDGRVTTVVYPLGALIASTAGALAVLGITTAFERERVRDLFSRFVPEDVVDEVLASTGQGLRLGGVERFATVMFTDLRGFTSSAENMGPDNVIEVLNHYLSEMSDAILDHGGTLVAYMGDGIMAVFGAPIARPDHADRALATAREMVSVRLPRFNEWMKGQGLGEGYRMGIGLNTGRVMSGNVGSERRVEYTSVGDATNTAARIEGLTKGTPHQLMFSEATRDALNAHPTDIMFVEEIQIRGRQQMTNIYSVRDGTDPEAYVEGASQAPSHTASDAPLATGDDAVDAQPETA